MTFTPVEILSRAAPSQPAEHEYVSPWRCLGRCVRDPTSALSCHAVWGAHLTTRSCNGIRSRNSASFPVAQRNLPTTAGGRSAVFHRDRGLLRGRGGRRAHLGIAAARHAHGGRNGWHSRLEVS